MSGAAGLALARCELHPEREAAVRCPRCRRDFCRECVAEHEGRLLCRRCLGRPSEEAAARRRFRLLAALGSMSALAAGLLVAWLFFYLLGRSAALLPIGVDPPAVEAEG